MDIREYLKNQGISTYLSEDELKVRVHQAFLYRSYRNENERKEAWNEFVRNTNNFQNFPINNYLSNDFLFDYRVPKFHYQIIDYDVVVHTIKSKKTYVIFSVNNGIFQIVKDMGFLKKSFISKPYKLDDIIEFELLVNNSVVQSNGISIGRTIAGGLLFGGLGAIAGALTKPSISTSKTVMEHAFRLKLNDMELASIEIPCSTGESAYRLLSTFELWEKKIKDRV